MPRLTGLIIPPSDVWRNETSWAIAAADGGGGAESLSQKSLFGWLKGDHAKAMGVSGRSEIGWKADGYSLPSTRYGCKKLPLATSVAGTGFEG
jgi:hypothetical protein